jgi:hypothetical protein
MLKKPELFRDGFFLSHFPLDHEIKDDVVRQDWEKLDHFFKQITQRDGALFKYLQNFHDFNEIEFIISIRDSKNDWEEDGIWHDDGSRFFAFSLSLTLDEAQIKGGRLGVRAKGQEPFIQIPTPPFGTIIMFLTGMYGYEHKIHKVTDGKRVVIAGWCS